MKKLLVLSLLAASVAGVRADEAFQASLTPEIALHSSATKITGLSLNIWGENPQSAVALGFVNGSTGDSEGFKWGFLANYDDSYTGVSWAFVNLSKEKFVGWQAGAVNVTKEMHGLQWGFVNYSENLRGVQLGFINIAKNNPWFDALPDKLATGFPIVNWSF